MSRILVCGDRNYRDYNKIWSILSEFDSDTTVIHGNCRGADKMAGFAAELQGMKVLTYPAEWKKYGSSAGPIRNNRMLVEGEPDVVIAFHENILKSKGTKNMMEQACEKDVDVILIE